MTDETGLADESEDGEAAEDRTERRYRRGIGITLAVLALLGAWIAVLQTNASTNESRTAREATRLASQAQTAAVLDKGVSTGLEQVAAEGFVFPERDAFQLPAQAAADAGVDLDPARARLRLSESMAVLDGALGGNGTRARAIKVNADRLSLEQAEVVNERITWNARASQYETVMTTLAVAIFLIGFTMVVGRKLRPPFAAPGLALALFCFGWALWIYNKPIPHVAPRAIDATAKGQAALAEQRAKAAVTSFDTAISADDEYFPAYSGRGLATLVAANPDLLHTLAITDDSARVVRSASADMARALELGGRDKPETVSLAALSAVVGAQWDRAANLLDDAIKADDNSPGLRLWRSAVSVAQGDDSAAQDWVGKAVKQMTYLKGTDTSRNLAAQYLTLMEWVAFKEPRRADLASHMRDEGVALITEGATGMPLKAAPSTPATVVVDEVEFVDGFTTVKLSSNGVPDDAVVVVAGYEQPAPGASWVQPSELFYVGPNGQGGGFDLPTPRKCTAVAYRFDLYVNGVFQDSADAAGGRPTC